MIAVDDSVYLVLHLSLVKWIQIDLLVLLTIEGDSGSSSGDAGWEDLKTDKELKFRFAMVLMIYDWNKDFD